MGEGFLYKRGIHYFMSTTNIKQVVIVTGSLAYDRIMNFPGNFKEHIMPDKIHLINLSFQVETLEEKFGGTAGNIAYSLKLFGLEPKIYSAVGKDFGDYKKHLISHGIDVSHIVEIPDELTAFVTLVTDLSDNQIAAFYPGALSQSPVDIKIPRNAELAIITPESKDAMIKRSRFYKEIGMPYIFDPGQQIIAFSGAELAECIDGAKMLIGNDYEIALLTRKTALAQDDLRKKLELLVITYGEQGSMVYKENKEFHIKAVKPKKVVDPTGAGDAYRAGFIAGLLQGRKTQECGDLGSWLAARAIENYGAQEHLIKPADFDATYRRARKNSVKKSN